MGRARAWFALLLSLAVASPGVASEATLEEIKQCVHENAPRKTTIQRLNANIFDRAGNDRRLVAKGYWKRFEDGLFRLLIRVEAPADLRGAAYLILEQEERSDMFVYLPAVGRVRRVNARSVSGSLFGTDFSYEDIDHLQRVSGSGTQEMGAMAMIDGRKAHVLINRPSEEYGSAYSKIDFYVDQETCVVLRADFFGEGDQLTKQMVAKTESLDRAGHTWYAREISMTDLKDQTHTEVLAEDVEVDVKIPRKMFSTSALLRRN